MKQVYPVIFTKIQDEKNTILIEVPDLEILTEGFGIVNAIDMARDAIGVKGIYYDDQGKELPNPRELKDIDISKIKLQEEEVAEIKFFTKDEELIIIMMV